MWPGARRMGSPTNGTDRARGVHAAGVDPLGQVDEPTRGRDPQQGHVGAPRTSGTHQAVMARFGKSTLAQVLRHGR